MACTHIENCPQFPLLSDSLPDWIAVYCEGERNGADCARYQMSLSGQAVPITLLPNGRYAHAMGSRAIPEPPAPLPEVPVVTDAVRRREGSEPRPTWLDVVNSFSRMRLTRSDARRTEGRWWVRVIRWLGAPA